MTTTDAPRTPLPVPAAVPRQAPAPDGTTAPAPRPARPDPVPAPPVLDLVLPVHDEEHGLERSVRTAHAYLSAELPYPWRLTIADNASTDATLAVARRLADELPGVRVLHLDEKGRGRALQRAWGTSDARVLAYMDVDLSTHLAALPPLVAPLVSGHSEVAIGTRLGRGSHVVRGPFRETVSRCYNLLLRGTLAARFSDAQCGFKAVRADVAHQLLPLVADTGWFFDTELLVLAEKAGLRIHEVPVDWVDDPDSRVDVVATAREDLRGVWRLGRDLAAGRLPLAQVRAALPRAPGPGRGSLEPAAADPASPAARHAVLLQQVVRFGVVGIVCTLAYALLFLLLRGPLGAQGANLLALVLTAVLNTGLNRRHTFGVVGREGALRHQGQGLVVLALAWALTSGALAALHALAPTAGHVAELVVLTLANLAATVLRFVLLRAWVFRRAGRDAPPDAVPAPTRPGPLAAPAPERTPR